MRRICAPHREAFLQSAHNHDPYGRHGRGLTRHRPPERLEPGSGGSEVRTHDRRGGQLCCAANGGRAAIHLDAGAHADQLLDVHEAVFEDVLLTG